MIEVETHPWFGIQAHLRKEKVVATQLEGRGYEVFLPQYRKQTYWSDRRIEVDCPLFPGYLFCRFDSTLPPIVALPSVVSIVGRGKQPEAIPDAEIDSVRSLLQSGFAVDHYPYLRAGDRVLIVKGPLTGVEGVLVMEKDKYRVVVSVNLLQRSIAVELDSESVRQNVQHGYR
jgi:transcription antitermination factor NusG